MLELRTLGTVGIHRARGERLAVAPKPLALLVHLAVARPRGPQRRDTLLALFHPELDHEHARMALRQLVRGLRAVVGPDVVASDRQTVAVEADRLTCDVHAFEVALAADDPAGAVALYGGPFLSGFFLSACPGFEQWVEAERSRLQRAYAGALERLALEADAAGDAPRAVALWRRLAEVDPYATRVTVRLIAALEVAGDRAGALAVADQHSHRLKTELDAEPSPEVETLARRLRLQPAPPAPAPSRSTRERLTRAVAGRYRVDRVLGAGGMALVYLADDVKLGRRVALKVLRPELAAVIGGGRFLNEVDIAAGLAHPNILPLHDAGEADGLLYYVMPYVEGESLRARLAREGPLPVGEAVRIAREVADALAHAHGRGIVHRDVKPANILLLADHAVVSDFGVARAISEATEDRSLVATTGTPAYMSPEQAAGSPDVDGRSDVYSLGCVLHEMLIGTPPHGEPTSPAVVATALGASAPPAAPVGKPVPATLEAALTKALAAAPADRFATAQAFAEALSADRVHAAAAPDPGKRRARRRIALRGAALVLTIAGAAVVSRGLAPDEARTPRPRTAIAVLPFENLNPEGPDAYLAPGLHDEVLTQLAKVEGLTVVGRTSVMAFAGTPTPLAAIAEELGVGSVVEGTVQALDGRLRVNVQLLDAQTGMQLWAERYGRTLDDAFAIQSDVALRVAASVGAVLSDPVRRSLAEAPTQSAEAYRFYLQGMEYWHRSGYDRRNWEIAQQLFERALTYDQSFALAHATLAELHGTMAWLRYDPAPERLVRQREEAELALRLAPDLPQSHRAMGFLHYVNQNWSAALNEFRAALRGLPSDAELWFLVGVTHRRLGNWDEVYAAAAKATQLDPRNVDVLYDLTGRTHVLTRRYADALRAFEEALHLAPDDQRAPALIGLTYLLARGELDTLRAVLQRLPPGSEPTLRLRLLLMERDARGLLEAVASADGAVIADQLQFTPAALYRAWAHELRGEPAGEAFASALETLDSAATTLPDDWRIHAARGQALAGLGRREDALREARWLARSRVYREDRSQGVHVAEARADILAHTGEPDAALDEIERLLAGPSWISAHALRLEPRWDPIRSHPRFQALLERYTPIPQ
jgi:serine/threonine-protein kinase